MRKLSPVGGGLPDGLKDPCPELNERLPRSNAMKQVDDRYARGAAAGAVKSVRPFPPLSTIQTRKPLRRYYTLHPHGKRLYS